MGCGEDWLEVGGGPEEPVEWVHCLFLPSHRAWTHPSWPRGLMGGFGIPTLGPDISHAWGGPEASGPSNQSLSYPLTQGLL